LIEGVVEGRSYVVAEQEAIGGRGGCFFLSKPSLVVIFRGNTGHFCGWERGEDRLGQAHVLKEQVEVVIQFGVQGDK